MRGRDTPPAPLKRGGLECCFLVVNEWFEWGCFPSGEGIEGCVMVRGAGWLKCFCCCLVRRCFLASGGFFDFRRLCLGVTHPQPLSRGEI